MKRYASHYLFLPGQGYLKQEVIETEGGRMVRHFPLTGEVEDIEWHPGLITLVPEGAGGDFVPYLCFPYDFTKMKPVAGTRRRQLP